MKKLSDYKETIHKCSKCGLCQSVCPAYLATGNECCVSKGQFIMLQGVINGDLKLNKNINKYLDICLKCGKCSNFCPSDINIVDVILTAKYEYFKNSIEGRILSFFQSKFLFNSFLKIIKIFKSRKKFDKKFDKKAIYFGGCIEGLFPKTTDFVKSLLNEMQIEVLDTDFNCCGLPFLTNGNLERFSEQAVENIKIIKDLNFDYFVTDCASCQWAWEEYANFIDDEELKEKLDKINFVSIYDLIEKHNIEFVSNKKTKVTYHKPCHGGDETFLERIKNIEYLEMEGKDECCGLSALFKPSTWKFAKKLYEKKRNNILNTGAEIILTDCVGCIASLTFILGFKKKIMRIIDFLAQIKKP